jgi:hypothetical protein
MAETGKTGHQETAQGGPDDERSDMVAMAPRGEDFRTTEDSAPSAKKRDGYAEAITALVRARAAAKHNEESKRVFLEAMEAVADGMALEAGLEIGSWEDLLKSPVKDLGSSDAFAVGREAAWLSDEGFRSSVDELGLVGDIERLLRSAIESEGLTPEHKAALDASWSVGDELATSEPSTPSEFIREWGGEHISYGRSGLVSPETLDEVERTLHTIDEFLVGPIFGRLRRSVKETEGEEHRAKEERPFTIEDVGRLILWTDDLRQSCGFLLHAVGNIALLAHEDIRAIAEGHVHDSVLDDDPEWAKNLRRFHGLDELL